MNNYYTYIVECSDNTLYTGYTTDISRRISEHNNGTGAKYTRGRAPVVLKYVEFCNSKSNAMRREYEIKQYSAKNKRDILCDVDNCIRVEYN